MDSAKRDLKTAIVDGDLEKVESIIGEHADLLRSDIRGERNAWTPLHYACYNNQEKIVGFLIDQEKERKKMEIGRGCGATNDEEEGEKIDLDTTTFNDEGATEGWLLVADRLQFLLGSSGKIPSYNIKSSAEKSPVFYASSTKIVEMMLDHLDDLEVTGEYGMPLLWKCADWGGVSKRVAQDNRLIGQYGQRWDGSLPLETAMQNWSGLESCKELVRGLHPCSSNVKAMNLRALLGNWDTRNGSMIQGEILKATWELVLSWLSCGGMRTGLTEDEELRLRATLMKAKGDTTWYDPNNEGHRQLLWFFCCDGNFEMAKYMLSVPGILDPEMHDGTTAFSMALSRGNCDLIEGLFGFYRKNLQKRPEERERDVGLAREALTEPNIKEEVKQVLEEAVGFLPRIKTFERGQEAQDIPMEELIEMARKFPYLNEESEMNWSENSLNKKMDDDLKNETKVTYMMMDKVDRYKVHDINFKKVEGESLLFVDCKQHAKIDDRIDCEMVCDMLDAARNIEQRFSQDDTVRHLEPKFELAGSITEGTRFGYANELDMGLIFRALKPSKDGDRGGRDARQNIPFKVDSDPFSLKKADTSQTKMDKFFDDANNFLFHKFKLCLLEATDKAVTEMYAVGDNPSNLQCIITNNEWEEGKTPCGGYCRRNMTKNKYKQCKKCAVTVSQTKIGITLQFVWKWPGDAFSNAMDIYCSLDIIPEFPIIPIDAIKLAKTVNIQILEAGKQPKGFLKYMGNYDKHYKVNLTHDGEIHHVVLKEMNFLEGRNHHVRPAQPSNEGGEKFTSERMRKIYCYIKFLKKYVDGVELSSFWVKKELLKAHYTAILDSCHEEQMIDYNNTALVAILSQPEFRSRVEGSRIDIGQSSRIGMICFKDDDNDSLGSLSELFD